MSINIRDRICTTRLMNVYREFPLRRTDVTAEYQFNTHENKYEHYEK